jgi:medium-chain acyl-[acyl-carrier-protein] hydrolase
LFTDLDTFADATLKGLESLLLEPYVFFGHSMGALLAFEMVRRLKKRGMAQPRMLILAGAQAPHMRVVEPTYSLPSAEFTDELRKINGTPSELLDNSEAMQLIMPILRADFRVAQTYQFQPGPRLQCPISVIGGRDDDDITVEQLEGWKDHTVGTFQCTVVDGSHFFVNEPSAQIDKVLGQMLAILLPS